MFECISALYRVLKPKKIACGATQCIFESISALYGAIKLHFFLACGAIQCMQCRFGEKARRRREKKIAFLDL